MKIQNIIAREIFDSRGVNLAGQNIVWADPLNSDFREQFNLILNIYIVKYD